MKILVTGGAGYIGSHTCVELLEAGYEVVVFDNLCNSKKAALDRVEVITEKNLSFILGDLRNKLDIERAFTDHSIDAVIHFAGLKAVGESVEIPISYYQNNIVGTLNLLETMQQFEVNNIVFSSSATVYGDPHELPICESFPLSATNPYGRSKLFIEGILRDLFKSESNWNISILRYFNPVGAHKSGLIGEDPNGVPNNLMPYLSQVAVGKRDRLFVYGDDYATADGTGVRDYIHVVDLAKGHIKALVKLEQKPGCITHNLGTGTGYSVLDMIEGMQIASGNEVPYRIVSRRDGDIATCFADPTLAKLELGWVAEKTLKQMCEDTWNWQTNSPLGYQ
ncbi:MAG: UDP-glucose 4-epimerase GalE [Pseudomonadales bacterium]